MWFYLVTLAHRDKLHQHDRTKFIGWLGFYGLLLHRECNFQSVEEIVTAKRILEKLGIQISSSFVKI